ncbi:hypothetical protein GB931_13505 [Modestobacter sp. I12A-02628]|uniref:Uncharacterized protein n=1 Tax=Goekera deserti TaxID=2497753 RepID=A0A7K3W9U5_9ACTN|nr:hypothetical protein [Goekera deserti]MPQ98919.1 hypothetical protein [Goekera deserti]NDI49582.1 hypothetical protein [Goekera deserti]NEL53225.1 hypothetical protein [Goekera deserti]
MIRSTKPSIFRVGDVRDDGTAVVVSGWGLGMCSAGCACHRDPVGGQLAIDEDAGSGMLGLVSHSEDVCDCCEPWTADELSGILRDLAAVEALVSQEPLAG